LAEWLDAGEREPTAPTAAGDDPEKPSVQGARSLARLTKAERSRQLGFRIVVE
jgi:hypothetical protein